jgi:RND family efflux transporter MFP subunit
MKLFSRSSSSLSSVLLCILLFFLISILSLSFGGCRKKEEPVVVKEVTRPVKLFNVEAETSRQELKYPGRVRASRRVDLAFRVAGPLIELPVSEGQSMKKGELIARILPRDFETEVAKAQASELDARQQFQRYRDLYVKKQVSKADFDKYKSQADIALARLQDAENRLSDTYLKAPFDGVIAIRYVENFEDVQAKEPIVSIQDIAEVEVLVDVPESVMTTLKRGGGGKDIMAEFSVAPGKQYPLALREFSTQADPRTQTYQVTLLMKQPDDITVLPGMTASVAGTTGPVQEEITAIIIPAMAVFADETGNSNVWVVNRDSMTVHKRQVTPGPLSGSSDIVIGSGLEPGETITVTGVMHLRENMKIRDLSKQKGFDR